MSRLIFGLILMAASFVANAVCGPTGCANVYVDRLYVNASGVIYVGTSGDEALLSCSAVSSVYVTLGITEIGANAIYSALLTAQTSNKLVSIRTFDNSVGCNISYVTLDKQ